jgi:hypothetical protein
MSKREKGVSMREYKARSRARQKNTKVYIIEIPMMAGLAHNEKVPIVISKDAIVKDTQDQVIIRVWESKVGKVNMDRLLKSTLELKSKTNFKKKPQTV